LAPSDKTSVAVSFTRAPHTITGAIWTTSGSGGGNLTTGFGGGGLHAGKTEEICFASTGESLDFASGGRGWTALAGIGAPPAVGIGSGAKPFETADS